MKIIHIIFRSVDFFQRNAIHTLSTGPPLCIKASYIACYDVVKNKRFVHTAESFTLIETRLAAKMEFSLDHFRAQLDVNYSLVAEKSASIMEITLYNSSRLMF